MPASSSEVTAWRRDAAEATRRGSRSFSYAARYFPPEMEAAAHGVYWFCRTSDDIVDENPDIDSARRELEDWRRDLQRAWSGERVGSPVLMHFTEICHRYRVPIEYPLDLLQGMRMDLNGTRYRHFSDLRVFCYRAASTVGLMMSHVIGFQGDALSYAEDLGIAMQLTNIVRDVGEDLARGRIYLPASEMEACGYSMEMLEQGLVNDPFRELIRRQIERARAHYERARPGISLLAPEGRFAVAIAADLYESILDQVEANGYDVFARRAVVPRWRKYAVVARHLTVPVARRSVDRIWEWAR